MQATQSRAESHKVSSIIFQYISVCLSVEDRSGGLISRPEPKGNGKESIVRIWVPCQEVI